MGRDIDDITVLPKGENVLEGYKDAVANVDDRDKRK